MAERVEAAEVDRMRQRAAWSRVAGLVATLMLSTAAWRLGVSDGRDSIGGMAGWGAAVFVCWALWLWAMSWLVRETYEVGRIAERRNGHGPDPEGDRG